MRALHAILAVLALAAGVDAQLITGRLGLSSAAPAPGERLDVEVLVDLSGDDAGLGAYQAVLQWDERVLTLLELADGESAALAGPQTRTAAGEVAFSAFNAQGARGLVSLLKATFEVAARPGQRTALDLSFSVLDAAGTFENLLPRLQIEPAAVEIGGQDLDGQVPVALVAPEVVAPGQLFDLELAADLAPSGARLGAYEGELIWNAAALELIDANPGDEAVFSTLQTRRADGSLLFSAFSVQGAADRASLLKARFRALGEAGQIAALAVSFTAFDEAGTFASLLPRLVVEPLALPIDSLSAPSLGLSASRLDFAATDVGQTSVQTLTLANPGNRPLAISALSSDSPEFLAAVADAQIEPGQSLGLDITFAPQTPGEKNAVFTIRSDDPVNPAVNIPLAGRGIPRSSLELSPASVRFPETAVGRVETRSLQLRNGGGAALEILDIAADSDEFAPSLRSAQIEPGQVLDLDIAFAPRTPGAKDAVFTIRSDDSVEPERQIALSASAVLRPNLAPSTSLLDFGETPVGATAFRDFSVGNLGQSAIQITRIAADDPAFTAAPESAALPPGASLTIRVTFAPQTPGAKNATLAILSDDPAAPDRSLALTASAVSLPGQGLPFAAFAADRVAGPAPLRVTFADQSTGEITAWQWDFGDGATSTEPSPVHIYREAGRYTARLIATGPLGSSAVATTIEVAPAPAEPSSDFDGNGEIDFGDFFILAEAFGRQQGQSDFDPGLDLVPDGKITLDDFFRFADRFGQ